MANMALRDSWNDTAAVRKFLAYSLNQGKLALLLGSGISIAYGLPDWEQLIDRLFASVGGTRPAELDLKRAAEAFRIKFHKGDRKGYMKAVKSALYDGLVITFEELRKKPLLASLGALVMSSTRGHVGNVITFNYDDLLEIYLEYHGFTTYPISEPRHWAKDVDISIFHPHGFLPSRTRIKPSSDIVLDQKSFSEVIGDPAKLWNQELITIMRKHICLIVGSSGKDDNLDVLLSRTKEIHAVSPSESLFYGVRVSASRDMHMEGILEERGVFTQHVLGRDSIPNFLFEICQCAAELRMNS